MVEQPNLLDVTRATEFIPGTNVKGEVAGGNWLFLLPSLELGHVLCIGTPRLSAVTMLSQLSNRVVIVDQHIRSYDLANVVAHQVADFAHLPALSAKFDVVLIGEEQARSIRYNNALQSALLTVSSSQTRVYWEEFPHRQRNLASKLALGEPCYFWLTPLYGEAVTAVPLVDQATVDYFLDRRLFSPSVQKKLFIPLKRKLSKSASPSVASGGASTGKSGVKHARSRLKWRFRRVVRSIGATMLTQFESAERTLYKRSVPIMRRGALVNKAQNVAEDSKSPPAYLRELAREAGIDIASHRWGIVASGEYSSRKVLCFLFSQQALTPEYIVKIVRSPRFNMRLENEVRALLLLNENDQLDPDTIPTVAFSGHHAGLAIVGESCIEGIPFQRRSTYGEDCPFGNSAIEWITQLGAANGVSVSVHTDQMTDELTRLFLRFKDIYPLTSAEADFLQQQLMRIRGCNSGVPAVFQHGDPGTWNMLVQKNGKLAVLDWEAAEPTGLPLWDLFYFLRSYAAGAAKKEGITDRIQGFKQHFLEERGLNRLITQSIRTYIERIGLVPNLVEPLFYTCWMHRALKESTLLTSTNLSQGYYFNVLRLCIRYQDRVVFQRLTDSQH